MPEGDTIALIASRLAPVLEGAALARFEAPRWSGPVPDLGETVTEVRAQGKFLSIAFSGGLVAQSHLRMTGSWHLYRVDEPWQRPRHQAVLIIGTVDQVAVCFRAPTVRLVRADGVDPLAHLGPDLCLAEVDFGSIVQRCRQLLPADTDLATALLDQRVAAGIGNVFKSEVLWAHHRHPEEPVGAIDDAAVTALFTTAHHQLRANLGPGPRMTIDGGLAVYGRSGRPCVRCGEAIVSARTGTPARFTYWCPSCQRAATG